MSCCAFKDLTQRETMRPRYRVDLDHILPVKINLDEVISVSSHGERRMRA